MAYEVKILRDSIAPNGKRLTTWELTYPRFVHAELMTHRLFSRNSASSRAIPIEKLIARVMEDPAMPVFWGKNQTGMQAAVELGEDERHLAKYRWLQARDEAVKHVKTLQAIGVHKQIANRLIEPWMWITVIVSATEFENWFHLRDHKDAQPELREVAARMQALYRAESPTPVPIGGWHLPLTGFPGDEVLPLNDLIRVSIGRCARVSYLTHDGQRDPEADIQLCDRLAKSGHWSPFEHAAQAMDSPEPSGNFIGWRQFRKTFTNEAGPKALAVARQALGRDEVKGEE